MEKNNGIIALMGSGEMTATMVAVHKELLASLSENPKATFLDTPAGFQLNADQISRKAVAYFRQHIQRPLTIASFKSASKGIPFEDEKAFQTLKTANYILMGPGSPTYAVEQLQKSPIPQILVKCVSSGGCLVVASAAALTVGRYTLPVYEIYKVGSELYWINGMDILARFGLNLVVVPHWNNAEGGTHDTRFCFMGELRFKKLELLLSNDINILGLDEHTAIIINFKKRQAEIRGIGRVVLRYAGAEVAFEKGDVLPFELLEEGVLGDSSQFVKQNYTLTPKDKQMGNMKFWDKIRALEAEFQHGLDYYDYKQTTNAILCIDQMIWQAQQTLEYYEIVSQAREILREMIVILGARLIKMPSDKSACFKPLIEELLLLRDSLRFNKQYTVADEIRDCLRRAGIKIRDNRQQTKWELIS